MDASSFTLNLIANWVSNGPFVGSTSTVNMAGFGLQTISGSTSPSFNNFTLNNTAGCAADISVTVGNNLTLTSGKLNIGNNTLTLNGGITTTASNNITSGGGANITIGGSGNNTIHLDQTTPGTTNRLGTFALNRTGNTITMGNDLQVSTALTLTNGKLAIASNTLTLNGSLSNTATNCLVANTISNIVIGGLGALGSNLFFDQTTPGTTNRIANYTCSRAQTITLGNALQVTGTLTPTAGTLSSGGNLTLVSNASGTARVSAGSGSYVTGNVTVERFIPSVARRWRFYGSQVSATTLADFKNEIYITGAGGAANGFDATSSNSPSVYGYNETDITGDLNSGYIAATNITDPITLGKGYRIFIRGDRSDVGRLDGTVGDQNAVALNVVGTLNMGNIVLPVSFTSSGNAANDGWCLVANPYASAIDWNAFHDAGRAGVDPDFSGTNYAHLKQTIHIYDPNTASYTSYNAVSNAGTGSLSNGIIPSGAAFWVQTAASSPTLTMTETFKTTSAPAAVFKQTEKPFTLKLIQDSITSDEAVLKYLPDASSQMDAYDISKLYGGDVNIASISSDGSFLSVNCKPFTGSDTIGLSLGFAKSGNYQMDFSHIDGLGLDAEYSVYLVDAFSRQIKDIQQTPSYAFTVDKNDSKTYGNERFQLVVGKVTTAVYEFASQEPHKQYYLYPSITSDWVGIYNRTGQSPDSQMEVSIVDMTGKTVANIPYPIWNGNKLSLDLSPYQTGVYTIQLKGSQKEVQTFRCIKGE
jgi:hypothetical protein